MKRAMAMMLLAALIGAAPAWGQTATPLQRMEATGAGKPAPKVAPDLDPKAAALGRDLGFSAEEMQQLINADQTAQQGRGQYVRPDDKNRPAGQIQEAWSRAEKMDVVREYDFCRDCFYHVATRLLMVTTIELPAGESIVTPIDLGDAAGFLIKQRGENRITVRPEYEGIDTSMVVRTASGRSYPFYLTAEGIKSRRVPNLLVRIGGRGGPLAEDGGRFTAVAAVKAPEPAKGAAGAKSEEKPKSKWERAATEGGDYVRSAKCGAHGDYGFGEFKVEGSEDLRPLQVYRDDCMTKIFFGPDRWKEMELPTAYVVWDEVDELVNTHVVDRHTLVIEAVARTITLKAGQKHLCISYVGNGRVMESGAGASP